MSKNKKTLLNEVQVRQFMKLAMLQPLANGFINEMGCPDLPSEEEDLYETHGRGVAEPPTHDGRRRVMEEEDMMDADEDMMDADEDPSLDDSDVELVDDEPEMEMEPEMDADSGRTVSVDEFLQALETALEGVMGDEVEIDADEIVDEPEDDLEMDVAEEPEADLEMGAEDAEADLLEAVTKRVAARILKAALKKR